MFMGIESSCDDTGVAIVSSGGNIISEGLISQNEIHAPYGGVVPNLARAAHETAIDGLVDQVVQEAKIDPKSLSAVAVTVGPGLSLCLKVGVLKARSFAYENSLPIVPVHHMEAHALLPRMTHHRKTSFPYLCILISGGHNLILVVHSVGEYTQMATTIDDSLGEAYDKTARLLGLELNPSGGAALEVFAREGDPESYAFKEPMLSHRDCNLSYAGLKTSVRIAIERDVVGEPSEANRQVRANIAASFQKVAIAHLERKCRKACAWAQQNYPEITTLVLSGGVAANEYVRERMEEIAMAQHMQLVCSEPRLCTDNGVMIAWTGFERFRLGLWDPVPESAAPPEGEWIDLRPRWPLTNRCVFEPDRKTPNMSKKKRQFRSLTELTLCSQGHVGSSIGLAVGLPQHE